MQRLLDEDRDIDEDDAALERRWGRIGDLMAVLNTTPPKTLSGCVAKLRFLTDDEVGMSAGEREDDVPSLRMVLAFIEDRLAIIARDAEATPSEELSIALVKSLFSEPQERALLIRALIADVLQ